jgi:hypothetical protein
MQTTQTATIPELKGTPWWVRVLGGLLLAAIVLAAVFWWNQRREDRRHEQEARQAAQALCDRWADRLDSQTTETGVYVRWKRETVPETDPWGRELRVEYSQGGVAETLLVRSLGPDGQPNTGDDIVAHRMTANFKGLGEGVKKNAEELSRRTGRGLVKGVGEGAREAVHPKKAPAQAP